MVFFLLCKNLKSFTQINKEKENFLQIPTDVSPSSKCLDAVDGMFRFLLESSSSKHVTQGLAPTADLSSDTFTPKPQ